MNLRVSTDHVNEPVQPSAAGADALHAVGVAPVKGDANDVSQLLKPSTAGAADLVGLVQRRDIAHARTHASTTHARTHARTHTRAREHLIDRTRGPDSDRLISCNVPLRAHASIVRVYTDRQRAARVAAVVEV
jgi:hypothetical protein